MNRDLTSIKLMIFYCLKIVTHIQVVKPFFLIENVTFRVRERLRKNCLNFIKPSANKQAFFVIFEKFCYAA